MENKYTFNKDFKIRYSELDCNVVLKPSSLLQLLQDVASEHAENADYGFTYLSQNNLAWFLLKYHIEFTKYPTNIYDLNIKTESRGWNKLFAFRDFEISSNDILLGKASTTWGLIDLNTKSMANISEVLKNNPNIAQFEKRDTDLRYNKIKPIQQIDLEKTFTTRFDDLDVNQHVNNSNFLTWAFETLDFDFRKTKKLQTLDIIFKKEIKYGAQVISQTEINNNETLHLLKNAETNEELCTIQAFWI